MSDLLQGLNVYLIGMMGSGKTTVGKLLAKKLDYSFVDTDVCIEKLAQKTVTEIFATEGEARFRQLESQTLNQISGIAKSVIATGGGIVQKPENWNYLHQGLSIWLDVDLNWLKPRLAGDRSRPLANQLESLLAIRRPLYAQADLHIAIKPEQTPEDIVTEIINKGRVIN